MMKASVHLSTISAIISLVSFCSQLLMARTFGAGHQFDMYLFAISIPFLVMGAATGAASLAFVPKLMAANREKDLYRSSVSALLGFAILAGAVIALGGPLLTSWSMASVNSVFNDADRSTIFAIAKVAWLSGGLSILLSALTAVHHTEKSFVLPALTTSSSYLGMIAAMSIFSTSHGPIILPWGMFAGACLSVLVLFPRVLPSISLRHIAGSQLGELFDGAGRVILVVIANCAFTGLAPVEAFLAPKFGPGALSYFGYSQRLIIAMGAVVVAGPLVLLVPNVAEACIDVNHDRVRHLSLKTIGMVCVIGTLFALTLGVLRVPLIRLVLQHGAFDLTRTLGVASILPWLLVGSIAMLGSQIAFRSLYGQNRHVFPALAGILVPLMYFVCGSLLSRVVGLQGICISYAAVWWAIFAALLVRIFGFTLSPIRMLTSRSVQSAGLALLVAATVLLAGQRFLLQSASSLNVVALGVRCCSIAILGLGSFALTGWLVWHRPALSEPL